ncbi:MAG: hypothetical protein EOO81_03540 [Oxalobacteraceae bacterium]|nr:MAG: hypothetical protein EOO81_03540 [Oxalobacteraceae bacterium]
MSQAPGKDWLGPAQAINGCCRQSTGQYSFLLDSLNFQGPVFSRRGSCGNSACSGSWFLATEGTASGRRVFWWRMMMKAVVYRGPRDVSVENVPSLSVSCVWLR